MKIFFVLALSFLALTSIFPNVTPNSPVPQVLLDANNVSTWISFNGVFNNDNRTTNTPGFQWPKGSNKFAVYTTGLSIGAYVNDSLRFTNVMYGSEFTPGYILNGIPMTDSTFKLYKVSRNDNNSNPDFANWGRMVPYGAPYEDINNNGAYDAGIDKPGIKNAAQTIFVCLTDGFPETHYTGSRPLKAEMYFTAWCYDNIPELNDVQFLRMEVLNKNSLPWKKTYFALGCDPDLGYEGDEYVGCDTLRNLSFCYNGDNLDGDGLGGSYGANPPAVGFDILSGAINRNVNPNLNLKMTSFISGMESGIPSCEGETKGRRETYNYARGLKTDSTPYVNIQTMLPTKFCYPGDPESNTGWNELQGKVLNCGGSLTGKLQVPSYPGSRRCMMSSGAENLTIVPGEKQTLIFAQMMARGSSNLNSVTKLKQLDDAVQIFYESNFYVGINPISSEVPDKFSLYQNYPNPFNPVTKIKFEISQNDFVNISVYDLNGRLVEELVNENISAGTYEVNFTAKNLSSGIYFYKLKTSDVTQTKKMILLK